MGTGASARAAAAENEAALARDSLNRMSPQVDIDTSPFEAIANSTPDLRQQLEKLMRRGEDAELSLIHI